METKKLNLEKMENLEGGGMNCSDMIVIGTSLVALGAVTGGASTAMGGLFMAGYAAAGCMAEE